MKQIVDKLNKIAKKINENVELSDRDLIIDSLDSITKAYGGTPNDSTLIVDKLDDIYNNIEPAVSGNIEITENGENINVAPFATATVNVSSTERFELLKTVELGHIATTSTSAEFTGQNITIEEAIAKNYDFLFLICSSDANSTGYNKGTCSIICMYGESYTDRTLSGNATRNINYIKTATSYKSSSFSNNYGIQPGAGSSADGVRTIPVNARYDANNTGTIDANYTAYLYGVNISDIII